MTTNTPNTSLMSLHSSYLDCLQIQTQGLHIFEKHTVLKHEKHFSYSKVEFLFSGMSTVHCYHLRKNEKDAVTWFYVAGELTRTNTITANAFVNEIGRYRFG